MTTEEILNEALTRMGFAISFSPPVGGVDEKWPHIRFDFTLKRNDKVVIPKSPYNLGIGRVKIPKENFTAEAMMGLSVEESAMLRSMRIRPHADFVNKDIQASLCAKLAKKQKVQPSLADVMGSLLLDGSAFFDAESFEDWAAEFGYDSDSRKGEAIFNACSETGRILSRNLSAAELAELRNLAQDL